MTMTSLRIAAKTALSVLAFGLAAAALPVMGKNHYILCNETMKCELPPAPPPDDPNGSSGKSHLPARYVATRIPQQGASNTSADAINAAGAIAGTISRFVDDYRFGDEKDISAFVFSPNNTLTGIASPSSAARAFGINDRGEVVGAFELNGHARAFKWVDGVAAYLTPPEISDSVATAINARGDMALTQDGQAFVMSGDGKTVALAPESVANAINVFGHVAGYFKTSQVGTRALYHAFRYADGALVDLGAIGDYAFALGINASGDVVGETFGPDNLPRPFLRSNGTMIVVGDRNGTAYAISSDGTVVGTQFDKHGSRAFVYTDGVVSGLAELVDGLDGAQLVTASAINDAGQIAARACAYAGNYNEYECFGVRLDPVPGPPVTAVEFHHAGMDHYFITADAAEIAKLDDGNFVGWSRTGEAFNVQRAPQAGTTPVCRMFSAAFAPMSSHFYAPSPAECAIVKRNPDWQFEGVVFHAFAPDASGACPAGTTPVYRLYNDGQGGAPNHRYTTSFQARQRMLDQKWVAEGAGSLGVAMCASA